MSKQHDKHDTFTSSSPTKAAHLDSKKTGGGTDSNTAKQVQHDDAPPKYAPPKGPVPYNHTNPVIEAARIRARDEVCSLSCFSARTPHC